MLYVNGATTMTEARIKVWTTKTGRKTETKVPKLCSLPPTSKVFEENVKRAHFQCATWRKALQESPNLDPTEYGWCKDEETKSLQPVTCLMLLCLRETMPFKLMWMCGRPFCQCQGSSICKSELTRAVIEESDEDEYQERIS